MTDRLEPYFAPIGGSVSTARSGTSPPRHADHRTVEVLSTLRGWAWYSASAASGCRAAGRGSTTLLGFAMGHPATTARLPGGLKSAWLHACLLILTALVLGGCRPEPPPVLRIGTNVWPGYEPLYLARHRGYFDSTIRLVEYSSASQVLGAYRNGAIEAAALTLDEALVLVAQGHSVRVLLVMDGSRGGDVLLGGPRVRAWSDVKGRRVGVEESAVGAYLLTRALQLHGLTNADIHIVSVPVDEHERAFREGRVDAVVTFEPVRTALLAAGATELFSSADIPDEILDVLVVRGDRVDALRGQLDLLLRGWFRALDDIKRTPHDAATVMAKRLVLDADQVLMSYRGVWLPSPTENRALLAGEPPTLDAAIRRLSSFMVDHRLLQHPVEPAGLVDPRPLLRIAP
ncbi:MAG: ABC transporter substrate-binding protein [Nitrospirota bacterium]